MVSKFSHLYSKNAREMKASEIRELLKLTENPNIISFAGGLPDPKAFPLDKIKEIVNRLLDEKGGQILQYGTTEGVTELRKAIADRMNKKGMNITYKNVLITAGSQQALDLISKTFLDPGDMIIVGAPTYLGGTNAFKSYNADMEGVPLDEDGIDPELLAAKLHMLQMHGKHPEILYLIPSFQNPAGVTITEERRREILEVAREYDMIVIEDSPYSELRYSGENVPSMKSMDTDGRVIYLGTFSKILAPGFRVAWCIAEKDLLNKLTIVKQAADLCTNTLGQHIASEYVTRGYLDEHVEKIKALYIGKRDKMLVAMDKYFPPEAKWTKPDGGMFIWVTLPEYVDTKEMFPRAIENNVAYVNGAAFFADHSGKNTMRLN
ncbi:MAG: PLP-dependent aminotransferase family protein, partial [Thermoplasmata archaeon]|nr:PLP-dependent aminotransferase family protein [Thermoplasmata archaeon]